MQERKQDPVAKTGPADAPCVSVIMNCLNSAADLPETLASLAAQTFRDYEVIFWDNGSTDKSPEIAKGFGPALRYFRGDTTVPLGAARNLAIAQARGELIAFLDCDDLWLPEKLERQVELFRANERLGLACTDTELFDGKRTLGTMFASGRPARGMVFAQLVTRQWISMSSAMVRRQALAGLVPAGSGDAWSGGWFDESLNVCEEADVFYRIAHDWELDHLNAPLTRWRVHGKNTTFRKFGQFAAETRLILAKHRRLYPEYDRKWPELVALLERRAAFQQAVDLWRNGQNARARACIAPICGMGRKYQLFWLATWLPGRMFDLAARLYFALPAWLRK